MKIVIAGGGEVGSHLAKMFSYEDHEITIMDLDVARLDALSSHYDVMTYEGNVTFIKDLNDVGINKTDLFVAVTSYESVNMTACMLASNMGAKKTLARVDNKEYVQPENLSIFQKMGVGSVIYPELIAAQEIVKSLRSSWQRINMSFCNDALVLLGVKVRTNAQVLNQKFSTGFLDHSRFRVVAIKRNNDTIIPRGDDMLLDGDFVYFITTQENIEFTRQQAGKISKPIHNVMIMGGSRIGINTAQMLPEEVKAKIIEIDHDRSIYVSEKIRNLLVINGDGRDLELLEEEGIGDMDAFVAVTGSSEANILACLAAKRFNIVKTIAEVENNDYIPLAQNLDIGSIVNKKLTAASHIYQLTLTASVLNVTCLPSSDARVIEFEAKEGSRVTRSNIRKLHAPRDSNFGGYVRNGKGYICSGDTEIQPGDHVIVFCQAESVHKIVSLF